MFEYARCEWKDRRGIRCGQRAVAVRDLGPAGGALRMRYVCTQHITAEILREPTLHGRA